MFYNKCFQSIHSDFVSIDLLLILMKTNCTFSAEQLCNPKFKKIERQRTAKFPQAPMGVLAPR